MLREIKGRLGKSSLAHLVKEIMHMLQSPTIESASHNSHCGSDQK